MHDYTFTAHHDLVTPDGEITAIEENLCSLEIKNIRPHFVGFDIDAQHVTFNLKSTLAQIGLHSKTKSIELMRELGAAKIQLELICLSPLCQALLPLLKPGAKIGKLFAADPRRKVQNPDYLSRMFGRSDRTGNPLLSLNGGGHNDDLILEKHDGHLVAYIKLDHGTYTYAPEIQGFLPTLAKALHVDAFSLREMLKLHQVWQPDHARTASKNELLLVRTTPLHILTCFGKVVDALLPEGFHHTSASVLQPDTQASGDIYELFGSSTREITEIPLEFYTLEPYREHVSFADRDQLQASLDQPQKLFDTFDTCAAPPNHKAAIFITKGTQLHALQSEDWIFQDPHKTELPGIFQTERQMHAIDSYIHQQPSYPFLKAIEDGYITSQGILFSRYFPSPMMKRMFLSEQVQRCLKALYFHYPSQDGGEYFSHEDRTFLFDLAKFGIPTFWADERTKNLLQYIPKTDKDTGMFVPQESIDAFTQATFIGIYGSNLLEGDFGETLAAILRGLKEMRPRVNHPLLSADKPLALVTGGGPGAMSVGNRVAQEMGILSCANIIDFTSQGGAVVNEQAQNPYVDIKMTYRLDKLIERQAEFNLDLPIFAVGGIGTDFEYTLEEARRKTGVTPATPVILLGPPEYWRAKITTRFQQNIASGTIKGSEWVSNCFHCVQTPEQALRVYYDFFSGKLPIGKGGPIYPDGFKSPS